ncbi:MAG: hypothetical protein ACTSRG_27115 [Candidatus Helarchaeota archaeon]
MIEWYEADKKKEFMVNVNNVFGLIGLTPITKEKLEGIEKKNLNLINAYIWVLEYLILEYYTDDEIDYFYGKIFNQLLELAAENREGVERKIWNFINLKENIENCNIYVIEYLFNFLAAIGNKDTIFKLEKLVETDFFWKNDIFNVIKKVKSRKGKNLTKKEILRQKVTIGKKPLKSFHDFMKI